MEISMSKCQLRASSQIPPVDFHRKTGGLQGGSG